jgi:hypothetical protein
MGIVHLVRQNRRRRTMKIIATWSCAVLLLLLAREQGGVDAFAPSTIQRPRQNNNAVSSSSALHMVLEKPKVKELPKIESLKMESDHLVHPLREVCTSSAWLSILSLCAFGSQHVLSLF